MTRYALLTALVLFAPAAAQAQNELKVTSAFPGGSARVESIDQQTRTITVLPFPHQDRGFICWWYFKVDGVQPGETLTLDVGGGVWATPDQATYSLDNKTWKQSSPGQRAKDRITYKIKVDGKEAWFAWGPPFVLQHANELVQRTAKESPHAVAFELCKSNGGRVVPALKVSQAGVKNEERLGVWVQARQHAWEAGSSWVCKGFVDWLVSNDPAAEALRKKAAVYIVPIMDVDNVETGAGGKNQKPHDHNRDWSEKPVYAEVAAVQKQLTELHKARKLDLYVDLHNPGAGDKQPFFFTPDPGRMEPAARANMDRFLTACRQEITGPLKLAAKSRESGSNYDPLWEKISTNWVVTNCKSHVVSVCLETSWNTRQSTTENYQRVGKELGLSIERCFRDETRPK